MEETFKWGIIGPGNIAKRFAEAVTLVPGAEVWAVASRSLEKANAFADKYSIAKRYDSYELLASDPKIDAVYIALPNPFHYANIMLCLEHGKPVLSEKPFTLNALEAKKAIALARQKGLFLMEAIWSRFLPVYDKVDEWIKGGRIGDVKYIKADIGFTYPFPKGDRHINNELGGGGLLDVGVYGVALASWVYGRKPERIVSMAHIGETGVDMQSAIIFGYDQGEMAVITTSLQALLTFDAWIHGSKGTIHVQDYMRAATVVLKTRGQPDETVSCPFTNGFEFEIMEVMNCIKEGKTESARMTLDETLANTELMDEARAQWGLVYPTEGEIL
jgi:dihydrodiol dehydrogenase / D-xylose 1-dehydrogenase (NADP)